MGLGEQTYGDAVGKNNTEPMVSMEMSDMLLNKSVTAVGESGDHCVSACSALVYRNTGAIYFSEFSLSFFLPTHPDTGGEMMEECFFFFFLHLSFHISSNVFVVQNSSTEI